MMKVSAILALSCLLGANAFTAPMMATRAITPKKAAPKKEVKAALKKSFFTPLKAAPKKAAPKKEVEAAPKKSFFTPLKAAPKKAAPKKAAPKKAAPKKAAPKKAAPKKAAPKKAAPKKVVAKRAPAVLKAKPINPNAKRPGSFLNKISLTKPAQPKLVVKSPSTQRRKKTVAYFYEDGLTDLERKQRSSSLATFLTGNAVSRADSSAVRGDLAEDQEFALSPYDNWVLYSVGFLIISFIVKAASGP